MAAVGVDAAVAEEGPVAANLLLQLDVHLGEEDLFLVVAGLGDDAAEGIGDEGAAPELEARAVDCAAADVAVSWPTRLTDADVDAVGDGVGALDGEPGVVLRGAPLGLLSPDASRWPWGRR